MLVTVNRPWERMRGAPKFNEAVQVELSQEELTMAVSVPASVSLFNHEPLSSWVRTWLIALKSFGIELSALFPLWRKGTVWWLTPGLRVFFHLAHSELAHGVDHCHREREVATELSRLNVDFGQIERPIKNLRGYLDDMIVSIAAHVNVIHRSAEDLATATAGPLAEPARPLRTGAEVVDALTAVDPSATSPRARKIGGCSQEAVVRLGGHELPEGQADVNQQH